MGIVSFLGRIGSMIAPFTATVVSLQCSLGLHSVASRKLCVSASIFFVGSFYCL